MWVQEVTACLVYAIMNVCCVEIFVRICSRWQKNENYIGKCVPSPSLNAWVQGSSVGSCISGTLPQTGHKPAMMVSRHAEPYTHLQTVG